MSCTGTNVSTKANILAAGPYRNKSAAGPVADASAVRADRAGVGARAGAGNRDEGEDGEEGSEGHCDALKTE